MKIETKFDRGDKVWVVYGNIKINTSRDGYSYTGVHLAEEIIEEIDITVEEGDGEEVINIFYVFNDSSMFEERVFPHTSEGKRQAEARVEELND